MEQPSKNKNITLAVVLATLPVFSAVFFAGVSWGRAQSTDEKYETVHRDINEKIETYHKFALEEVSGLRSDMDKEDAHLKDEIKELKK